MKFSVIVPVYNVEKYLSKCLVSILNQTYRDFELILVDDGSTDNSSRICDHYESSDDRIKVIHKKNGGSSSARNEGIKYSSGDYIIFMDSDDYWASNDLLRCVADNTFDKKNRNIVAWGYEKVSDDNYKCDQHIDIQYYNINDDYKYLIKSNKIFASAWYLALPRIMFESNDLFFEENVVAEDIEWFARVLLKMSNITYLDGKFYAYRQRKGSISNVTTEKTIKDLKNHINKIIDMNSNGKMQIYLAEQISNFYIILSHYNNYKIELKYAKEIYPLSKSSVRKRSKIINLIIKIFGIKNAMLIINILKKVSDK